MAYIAKSDYSLRINVPHFEEILSQAVDSSGLTEDQIREDAEQTAITEINAYLTGKYIMEDEFTKDGTLVPDPRNKFVLKCVMDIALYNIHFVINPRDVPEIREKAYNACLENLAAYRDGRLIFLSDVATGGVAIRPDGGIKAINLTSQRKFISKPYQDEQLLDDTTL
jgi:hypothetical protein